MSFPLPPKPVTNYATPWVLVLSQNGHQLGFIYDARLSNPADPGAPLVYRMRLYSRSSGCWTKTLRTRRQEDGIIVRRWRSCPSDVSFRNAVRAANKRRQAQAVAA